MRVVHVAEVTLGGVGAYLGEIAPYQVKTFGASNVFFVVPEGSEAYLQGIEPSQIIAFPRKGRSPLDLLRFGRGATKAIRRIGPDLVHLHSTFAGAVLRPMLAKASPRPKIVYCPHGWAFSMEGSNLKRMLYAEYERLLVSRSDLIVVNSESERRLGAHYGIDPGKMLTVWNGIASSEAKEPRPAQDAESPVQVAFIGRFDRQKGLDLLLDTVEALPRGALHLHLVGKGDVYGKGGPSRVERADVTVHGWLSRDDVVALLGRMDAVVMPSRWEAQGLVALEAMRSGVAVIASDRGGLPEVVRNGLDGIIFDLDDREALRRILGSLDRDQLRHMGENGQRRFESEFTAERMNGLLCRAYQRLLGADIGAGALQPDHVAASIEYGQGS